MYFKPNLIKTDFPVRSKREVRDTSKIHFELCRFTLQKTTQANTNFYLTS